MISEACRVGIMFFDTQVRFVVQQTVEYVSRVANADVDDLDVERRVLIGDVGVERPPWATAIFRIDVTSALGFAPGTEVLSVR